MLSRARGVFLRGGTQARIKKDHCAVEREHFLVFSVSNTIEYDSVIVDVKVHVLKTRYRQSAFKEKQLRFSIYSHSTTGYRAAFLDNLLRMHLIAFEKAPDTMRLNPWLFKLQAFWIEFMLDEMAREVP